MKPFSPFADRSSRAGFTLIELLVAAAILVLLTGLLIQILDSSSRVIGQNRSRFSAETRAQAVLGLFDQEIQTGIFRRDLPAFPGGKFELFTQRPAAGADTRAVSLVGYRLDPSSGALQRTAEATSWTPGSASVFAFSATNTNSRLPAAAAWREVAPGVVALRTTFIGRDGISSTNAFSHETTNATQGILLTVATIDERTERELKDSGKLAGLMNDALWNATPPPNQTFAQFWEEQILKDSFRNGQPPRAASSIRIAERYVPIPR